MSNTIGMTAFTKAMTEARKLEDIADDIRALVKSKIKNLKVNDLSNWKGESSIAFLNELEEIEQKMMNEAKNLDSYATTIRQIARKKLELDQSVADILPKL